MVLKTVIKSIIFLQFLLCYNLYSQNNEMVTYHVLFKNNIDFNADKIDFKNDKIIFGMTTDQKKYFPGKYLFVYEKDGDKVEISEKDIEKIKFANIHHLYWTFKNSDPKPKIYLYRYIEKNCYYKYPVSIEFPPPPPYPGPVD